MSSLNHRRVFEVVFPADPRTVFDVRLHFEEFIRPHGLHGEHLEAVKVAVSEAYTNAVCHGSPNGTADRVRVRFELSDDRCLSVDIWDEGDGFQPVVELPDCEEWKPSGRGLFLISALMDSVLFEPAERGTWVRMTKQLPPDGEPDEALRNALDGEAAADEALPLKECKLQAAK